MNKEQQDELNEAIGLRALYGKRFGWGYATKWFAAWQKEFNKRNGLTH